ncbi:pleckstrin homology domain-containing family B member 2 [Dugong dugon]
MPAPLVKEIAFSPFNGLRPFVKQQLLTDGWIYIRVLNYVPLVYVFAVVPVPGCFDYYGYIVGSKIRAWKFTLQDSRTNTAYVGSEVIYDEMSVTSSPPPYTAYAAPSPEQTYGFGPYNGAYPPGTHIVYTATRQAYAVPFQYPYVGLCGPQLANQVIIRGCYRANDSDIALGMLAGAATGMASGSLFWVL